MTESLYRRIEASELFAREVAHELKNPLTAARSTAESLAYAKTPEMRDELVRQIQGELARLNKLISDVSNVSRLDAELAYGETKPVDIRDVLHAVMAIFQDRFSDDTRKLVLDIQARRRRTAPSSFCGHEARLGRVITNLLDNAISFSPEDGMVTVRARRVGAEIEIVVDDDGPGIPPDMLDNIFERFYSDRPQSDSTHGKNSGLGLSISRDIVDAYGGSIVASNRARAPGNAQARRDNPALKDRRQPGVAGARFTVRLPAEGAAGRKERSSLHDATELVHGTCVALGRRAALLRGAPGSGKSDLALRFLFLARRGPAALEAPALVADDQVRLSRDGDRVLAAAPESIVGKMEVRGRGHRRRQADRTVRAGPGGGSGRRRIGGAPAAARNGAAFGRRPAAAAAGAARGLRSHQARPGPGARGPQLSGCLATAPPRRGPGSRTRLNARPISSKSVPIGRSALPVGWVSARTEGTYRSSWQVACWKCRAEVQSSGKR